MCLLVFGSRSTEDQSLYAGYQTVLAEMFTEISVVRLNTILKVQTVEGKRSRVVNKLDVISSSDDSHRVETARGHMFFSLSVIIDIPSLLTYI